MLFLCFTFFTERWLLQNKALFKFWSLIWIFLILSWGYSPVLLAKSGEQVEAVKNKKGRVNKWIYRKEGVVYKTEHDRNRDGKPDFRVIENHGRFLRKEYDDNFDGKFERIEKAAERGSSGHTKYSNSENGAPS